MAVDVAAAAAPPAVMRFTVDSWDPAYGTSFELDDDLTESTARIVADVEVPQDRWQPIPPRRDIARPAALLFVDGVRRIDARVWIEDYQNGSADRVATVALGASYAAGVLCCCDHSAHVLEARIRRGLFSVAPHASDVITAAGAYRAHRSVPSAQMPLEVTLSAALQHQLGELEIATALAARAELAGHGVRSDDDLLIIDGPLRGRQHLPRAIGYIKSHRSAYLPPQLHAVVAALAAGERTPAFLMGTSWNRHAWYLRLAGQPGQPWAGIVRIECSADLARGEVTALADLSQSTLGRYASAEYKDPRAPQNLYPIAGLERELRRRLGDVRLLYRALRTAASAAS